MRKLLRDKYSTILLITGFVLSCFVAVNVLTMMNEVKNQQNRKSKSDYKNTKNFEREMPEEITKDKIEEVVQELHTDNGNVFIYGYYSFVGSGLYNPCIYLIVSENEKADRQFIWGRMPNEEERRNKENVIAAGTNMNPYIQEKDGEIADSGHADADRVGIAPEQIGQGIGNKKGSAEEKHFYNLLHARFRVPVDCHDDGKQPAYKTAHQLNGSLGNFQIGDNHGVPPINSWTHDTDFRYNITKSVIIQPYP